MQSDEAPIPRKPAGEAGSGKDVVEGISVGVHEDSASRARWLRPFYLLSLIVAAAGMLVIVATLMVGHWYTLPKPAHDDPRVGQALNELRDEGEADAWLGVHVLYSDCGCSRRVLDHLVESKRPADLKEKVLLVGAHPEFESQVRSAGFDLLVLQRKELKKKFFLESAPLFIVAAPSGDLRYVGGYTSRKRGIEIRDVQIAESLISKEEVVELPLFGCAVSKSLQEFLDPLGMKYSSTE